MVTHGLIRRAGLWFLLVGPLLPCAMGQEADRRAEDERFFEAKIRPLLLARCGECHGPEQQKGKLRLDSRDGALQGGDTGPALVPGEPEQSLLIDAVRYGATYQMPPKGKLPDAEVALLVDWVRRGAPWPAEGGEGKPAANSPSTGAAANAATNDPRHAPHWAFTAPTAAPLPDVRDDAWPERPLDRFILARLEASGLQPAAPAGRRELLRRVTYDLTGLPPTADELSKFENDASPEAWARTIDRLLAAPQYGQRWGRHWLDVARYADSNGMDENLAHANAWRYRDYVIDAFNADLPYDQFVREQLAGDLLEPADETQRNRRLAATGFLTLGPKMLAEDDPEKLEMDVIDEQLDTLGVAVLGMTFGCARCHDHKFDPFSMADYYALAGVFKSTKTMDSLKVVARWHERPLATAEQEAAWGTHTQQLQRLRDEAQTRSTKAREALAGELRARAEDYLTAAVQSLPFALDDKLLAADFAAPPGALLIEAETFARGNVRIDFETYGNGIGVIYNQGPLPNTAEYDVEISTDGTYQILVRYAAAEARPAQLWIDGWLVRSDLAGEATGSWQPDAQRWQPAATAQLSAGRHTLRFLRHGPFPHFDKLAIATLNSDAAVSSPEGLALAGRLHRAALDRWIAALRNATGDEFLAALRAALPSDAPPDMATAKERVRALVESRNSDWQALLGDPAGPAAAPAEPAAAESCFDGETLAALMEIRGQIAAAEAAAPTLPMAMAVAEGQPQNLRIHVRGSHWTQADEVPRRFPAALPVAAAPEMPSDRSGRLELADWLTRSDHPLTARVIANRVWRWRFGRGLAPSTDNFGRLGEAPTHPELLDWLATTLIERQWSLKSLHRELLLSATYRQSSDTRPGASAVDPENRLWWRMPRRRLAAEEIRDGTLAVCGQLDVSLGGTLLTTKNREYVASTTSVNTTRYESPRRSVYLPVVRSALYEMFQAFDFADPSVPNGDRSATTVAPQGLFALNSPLVTEATQAWATSLLSTATLDDAGRVQAMFLAAYGRPPQPAELSAALAFVENECTLAADVGPSAARQAAWQALCRVVLGASEFVFLD